MLHLKILSGNAAGQSMLVRRFPFRVGRTAESGLRSTDRGVWDAHFEIEYRSAEGFILMPVEGALTLLDAETVLEPTRLAAGAEITAGAMRIKFNLADTEARSGRSREIATWLAVVCVVAVQIWLLSALPK